MSYKTAVDEAKDQLTGHGIGEAPPIRRVASTSAFAVVNGDVVTFDLVAGEGAKVRAGEVLSSYNATDATDAWVFYILSVSTDTVTVVNGYQGAPSATVAGDLDDVLLNQGDPDSWTEYSLYRKVQALMENQLYPSIWSWGSATITSPSLATHQAEIPATVLAVEGAWQVLGGIAYPVSWWLTRDVPTAVSSTNSIFGYDARDMVDGSDIYVKTKEKFVEADLATEGDRLVNIVGAGTAALALDAGVAARMLDTASKDAKMDAGDKAGLMWRSFLTQLEAWAEELERDTDTIISVR